MFTVAQLYFYSYHTLSWIRGVKGHLPIFKQKHSILGLDFVFAYKELIWNKNYHFKSKNNQFMNILSFEQKFYYGRAGIWTRDLSHTSVKRCAMTYF